MIVRTATPASRAGACRSAVTATVTATINDRTLFLVEAKQGGIFEIRNIPEEAVKQILGVNCPGIIYPYLRAIVSDVCTRAGFPPVMPLMKAGSVKVLAVSSAVRAQAAPEIPSVAEATGFADFDFTLWQGFFAPKGTPQDVVVRLNSEINKILADPPTRQKLIDAGANVASMSIGEFAAFVKTEAEKYERIIRLTGVKTE